MDEAFLQIQWVEKKGKFIKPCPGTPGYVCCGYQIIDFAHGCNLGCTYCALNYYNYARLTVFQNREKLFDELDSIFENRKSVIRFGTGEFTDSLLFEKVFPIYDELIPYISRIKNAVLEIKTKTVNIESLLKIKNHKRIIVSWSVGSELVARHEEKRAPGIEERISAASRIQDAGYKLAFHFDPIILHSGWEEGYKKTIDSIFRKIKPENIVYISLGTLRFVPEMAYILNRMSPECRRGEFIKGTDNKMRYFRPLRTEAYRTIKRYLENNVDENVLYLCMESPIVWEDVFSIKDMDSPQLEKRLDAACINKFGTL